MDAEQFSQSMDTAEAAANCFAERAFTYMMTDEEFFKDWSPEAKATFMAGYMKAAAIVFAALPKRKKAADET